MAQKKSRQMAGFFSSISVGMNYRAKLFTMNTQSCICFIC